MNHLAKVAGGAAWMLLFKVAERAMSVIGIVILARLLLPEDFGLVAMATSVIALLEVLGTFSFDLAIIQRKEPTREHYDTAWTMNVLAATGGAVATALVAWPAAQFYSEPRLVGVMHVLALCWALQGLENIGTVNFRREMNFSREFHFLFAKKLWSFVVTVVLAWAFRNYWALLIGTLSSRVFGVALSYFMHPYRPRPSLARRRELPRRQRSARCRREQPGSVSQEYAAAHDRRYSGNRRGLSRDRSSRRLQRHVGMVALVLAVARAGQRQGQRRSRS